MNGNANPLPNSLGVGPFRGSPLTASSLSVMVEGRDKGVREVSRKLLILTVVALMASLLAFGLSGVVSAQNELAVVADDTKGEECAELVKEYKELVVEDTVAEKPEVDEPYRDQLEICARKGIYSYTCPRNTEREVRMIGYRR